ncbi:hypothetical protein TNCV_550501 [Trichonephila clavipes]|nr:hypothetical protein TNCV_550501 [Trichonephila clavipes]
MAHENIKWTETLPAVLPWLASSCETRHQCFKCRISVWCFHLRLPTEICTDTSSMPLDYMICATVEKPLRIILKPLSTSLMDFQNFMHPKLDDCSHVFLRVDKVSPSLSQPYTGPHEVLSKE